MAYTEVEAMKVSAVDVSPVTLLEGFKVDWDGGESGEAEIESVINFNGVDGLAPSTNVWPLIIVTDGPNDDSGDPVTFTPGCGMVGNYRVTGIAGALDVTFTGPTPI